MKISGIYKITHIESGKVYVGSSIDIQRRFNEHRHKLIKHTHGNAHMQKAWDKYGENSFCFSIAEQVVDISLLLSREQFWIHLLGAAERPNFNVLPTAGNALGFRHTAETKAHLSKVQIGNKRGLGTKRSPETLLKMSASQLGNKKNSGKKHTIETKILISIAHTGMKRSNDAKLKMSIAATNRVRKPHSAETVEKIRSANTGKKHSMESIQKMKDSHKIGFNKSR